MKKWLITLCLLVAAWGAKAQESEALVFTRIERNPRAAAMAGAGMVSEANVAYSGFGKAASLAFMEGTLDAGAGFQLWAPGDDLAKTTNLHLGAAGHFGAFGVSLGMAFQSGVPEADFAPTDRLVGLGLAYGIGRYIGVGVNVRYAGQTVAPDSAVSGVSGDLSVSARIPGGFKAMLGVSTLGTRVQGSQPGVDYVQPAHLFESLVWHRDFAKVHSLELALDSEYDVSGAFGAAFGAEYAYDRMVFVRAGYRAATENAVIPAHLALGLGFRFAGFRIEAAWMGAASYPFVNNTLTVGLGYQF